METTLRQGFVGALLAAAIAAGGWGLLARAEGGPANPPSTQPTTTQKKEGKDGKDPREGKDGKHKVSDEELTLDFLRQYQPEVYRFVGVVKEKDPKAYADLMRSTIPETKRLLGMRDKHKELFEITVKDQRLAFQSMQLARDIRNPPPGSKPTDVAHWRQDLREVLARQFDVKQQLRKMALEDQQKRIDDLKRQIEQLQKQLQDRQKDAEAREQKKDELINQRITDLLSPKPKLEW